MPFGLKSVGAT
jgi:hypothetical protein